MTTKELRAYIDRTLGNSIRCLLPSYWWKRIFGMVVDEVESKQDKLVSGSTIKTINGQSIIGKGDIEIEGGIAAYEINALSASLVLELVQKIRSKQPVLIYEIISTSAVIYYTECFILEDINTFIIGGNDRAYRAYNLNTGVHDIDKDCQKNTLYLGVSSLGPYIKRNQVMYRLMQYYDYNTDWRVYSSDFSTKYNSIESRGASFTILVDGVAKNYTLNEDGTIILNS